MRIQLINMPWHTLDCPSLALGILQARAAACRESHNISIIYGNIRWAEYILMHGETDPTSYIEIADNGFFYGIGDWVFSSALYDETEHNLQPYTSYLEQRNRDIEVAARLHKLATPFIDELAQEIISQKYDIVGFTSTFLQNVPSLSLAKRLKQLDPSILIVFGGGNCDDVQGITLHRNFSFIDYVVRGEGEQTFVEFLDALSGYGSMNSIEGLCWRQDDGTPIVNKERTTSFPVNAIPTPIYDTYFENLWRSPVMEYIEPRIVIESARGCWWGEKHQCTFCGLNGSVIKFRSRKADLVLKEIEYLTHRHQSLDVVMVDNIIDMNYFKSLVPQLIQKDWDIRIHYEIKSNLTDIQIRTLREAKILHVQPGIESLSSRVLQLMRKGVTGIQNIRVLRDCEENNLTVSWNYLYGFPGETADDYLSIIEQMPSLIHLQPPGGISRIALERFSPNYDDPCLGFPNRKPSHFYSLIYNLSVNELADMVYLFDTDAVGIGPEVETLLHNAVDIWTAHYAHSSLTFRIIENELHIRDRRNNKSHSDIVISDPQKVASYIFMRKGLTKLALRQKLIELGNDIPDLDEWLEWLKLQGLVFEESGAYIALATRDDPRKVRFVE